ncbi:MAG: hypothetical protein FJX69_08555 [Alphaproteobacteria bacterium]|nr:hypothetical protein [Alphaproteobacteria bacterium]
MEWKGLAIRVILAMAWFGGCTQAGAAPSQGMLLDFEAPAIDGAFADIAGDGFAGDGFAASGVRFRTVRLAGTVARGAIVSLAPVAEGLHILRDAPAISGQQAASPALGGGYNDLLMEFAASLASISLAIDDMVEAPNPIRLLALAATTVADRFRVVDFVEAMDDAIEAPANRIALEPVEPFSLALFEARQQQEGFDDLVFAFAPANPAPLPTTPPAPPPETREIPLPSSLAMLSGAVAIAAIALQIARRAPGGRASSA